MPSLNEATREAQMKSIITVTKHMVPFSYRLYSIRERLSGNYNIVKGSNIREVQLAWGTHNQGT